MSLNTKVCLVCQRVHKRSNLKETVYHNIDEKTKDIWIYCCACSRSYSLTEYCNTAGIKLKDYLKQDFDFTSQYNKEIQTMPFPKSFMPIYAQEAIEGKKYLETRGIDSVGAMFYDARYKGIAFPYYYYDEFCGAQTRLIKPIVSEDGGSTKMVSIKGTRTGLLFYNWNQDRLMDHVGAVVITEGAFNCVSFEQSLNHCFGGALKNPFKSMAMSGASISDYQADKLKTLIKSGIKVILCPDSDNAGLKMLSKAQKKGCSTHYCLLNNSKIDWNDYFKTWGKEGLVSYLFSNIKKL